MTTGDIQSRKAGVLIAAPDESVGTCLDRMVAAKVGSILVVDDSGILGIVTERDVLNSWRDLSKAEYRDGPVMKIASKPVFSLTVQAIGEAAKEMVQRRIRHVPLVDDKGKVAGIVSMRDILLAQYRSQSLPRLVPQVSAAPAPSPAAAKGARTLHIVKPSGGVYEIVSRILPEGWTAQVWASLNAFGAAPELSKPGGLRHTGLMLDLDRLQGEDWRPLVRRLIQTMAQGDQPTVFLVASEASLADRDFASLKSVAERANWRVYRRPLATGVLQEDLQALADSEKAS